MPMPQDPSAQSMDVAALAAQALGPDPNAMPPEAAAQMGGQMPPAADAAKAPSQQDQAASKGAPETEGDKSAADAVIYEIQVGDKTRKMTPQQISSSLERYAALNYAQAQYRPVLDAINSLRENNPDLTAQELAEYIGSMKKAGEKNTTLGKGSDNAAPGEQGQAVSGDQDMDALLAKWEDDNAASLPPGYKEMMQGSGPQLAAMQQQMQQMQQMMRMVLAQAGGATDAARMGMQQAQGQQVQAIQQQIANNLDRVQAALKIPDDRANDFMMFAAERGYTMEDFVDPRLTVMVMQDFRNNMDGPEMERMRGIAQRRQAYTGSMGAGLPGGAPAATGPSEMGTTFDAMTDSVMAQRGLT